jgi:hypothetical protein
MASRLTVWLLAGLLLTIGTLVYRLNSGSRFHLRPPPSQLSPARARASRLAQEWRQVEQSRRVHALRKTLADDLRRRAAIDSPTVAMVLTPADALAPQLIDSLRAALGAAWQQLGLGVTKVGVGVVLNMGAAPVLPGMERPSVTDNSELLLLPDSLEPTVCLVMTPIDTFGLGRARRNHDLAGWLEGSFGACAYYARFGVPAPRIRHWLIAREFDVARNADWYGAPRRSYLPGILSSGPPEIAYGLPPAVLACFAGRAAACTAELRIGDRPGVSAPDGAIALRPPWRFDDQRLVDAGVFLARVLHTIGPQRFLEFWNTTLPVDSALTLALRQPAGEWTGRWQRSYPRTLRVTPRAGGGEVISALLEIAVALGCTVLIGQRREVG